MKIGVSTLVRAALDAVWRAYTTPEDIKQWNAASADWHTTAATVDAETTHSEEQQRGGWQAILDNFARHVETAAG